MVPDLKLEVVYFNALTDFKLEFKLCGVGNVRFLSAVVSSDRAFLLALQRSVGRSRAVVTVGGLNPKNNLLATVARAVGLKMVKANGNELSKEKEIEIPEGSIPLFSKNGNFAGVVIEKGEQSIIMLSDDRELTYEVVDELVLPYLKLLISKKDMPVVAPPAPKEITDFNQPDEDEINEEQEVALEETKPEPEIVDLKEDIINEEAEEIISEPETDIEEITEEQTDNGQVVIEDTEETINEPIEELEEVESEAIDDSEEFINIEDLIKQPEEEAKQQAETDELLRNIVLKKMDISEVEWGSHDKFINPSEEALFVEEELYVGKHAKNAAASSEILEDETKEETESINNVEPTDEKEQNNSYDVGELPSELDAIDELSYTIKPETKTKRMLKAILAIVLVILIIVGSFFGYKYFYQPTQGQSIYQNILSLYGRPSDAIDGTTILPRFGKLYELNNQLVGFVSVPNSSINYPVVKTTTAGAVYCQTHLFDGTFNGYGTPYTFNHISGNKYNRNIVIYGNTVSSGEMFSDLTKYTSLDFYRTSPVINFDSLYAIQSYKVFSVLQFTDEDFKYYKNAFFDDQDFYEFVTEIKEASIIKTNVDLLGTDSMLTLVTEKDGLRTCVFARLIREGESPLVDVSDSAVNEQPEELGQNNSSNFNGGDLEITEQDNVSGGRHEEDIPTSSALNITASKFVPSSSSSYSSNYSSSSRVSSTSSVSSTVTSIISSAQNPDPLLPTLYVTNDTAGGVKVSGSTIDILSRIVEAEMGNSYEVEALKAQAVCKYSWLLCEGATNGKSYPNVAMKTASTKTINAVKEVLGVVVRYNGKVAQTFCYAFSAGKTANATDLWGGSYPWVRSVDSSPDKNASKFQTVNTYKAEDIAKWVKAYYTDIDLTKISDKNSWFVPEYDSNNLYVTWISIGGVKKRGSHLRTYILTSANCGSGKGLRSPAYTISYNAATDSFTFTVKGYGHGAGLSQFGANQYAKQGWTYDQILKHYFTGIDLGISYGK